METLKFTNANKLHFLTNGLLKKIPGTEFFEVAEEFHWFMKYGSLETRIIVERGFKTNFGSVPRFLRSVFSPTRYISYVLHDKLYSENHSGYSRKEKDKALREGLKIEGAGLFERNLVYIGVRWFGFLYYNK